jgi:outer membrane receptor protein involved in Fe transport
MISKKLLGGAALAVLSLSLAAQAHAQETTSAVRGEVTDATGGPIAGATVVVTHVPSGTRAVTRSGPGGVFDARGLRVGGPYTLEVTAPDYQGERIEDVYLSLGNVFRVAVDLESSQEEIVVMGALVRRGVDGAGPITALNRDDIEAVTTINRDVRDLARRDPLVSQDVGTNRGAGGQSGISIAGSSPRSNRITVDGVQAGDDFGLNTGGLSSLRGPLSLDAVEQFAVQAVPFDVEEGDFTGGALAVVLRQGGNDLKGSLFVNYQNDGMVGRLVDGRRLATRVSFENYGGFVSGPIIEDKLFLALSAENFFSLDISPRGPGGAAAGFANGINGIGGVGQLTQANLDAIFNDPGSPYQGYAVSSAFPVGNIPLVEPIQDTKWSARLDWNITDKHRANFTYREAESEVIIRNLIGNATSAGFDTTWNNIPEQESVSVLQVNSDWTPNFSTEVRLSYRDYERQQSPYSGQDFAEVDVCLENLGAGVFLSGDARFCSTNVPTAFFGPDQFRHANYLQTDNTQAQVSGEYSLGDHVIKAGVQWQRIAIFNLFVPQSEGVYNFDGIEAFAAGVASQFRYQNALSGDPNDAAAEFNYATWSAFVQDSWDVSDELTLTAGLRYDFYTADDKPAFNPNFQTRNGFRNDTTYDGLDVIMPRFSFEYTPTERLEISGGVGLVSGGLPDVFLSNSFGNTGILTSGFDLRRNNAADTALDCVEANGAFVVTEAICNMLTVNLADPSTFQDAPALAQQLVGGLTPNPFNETNALAKDFEMVADWRGAIKVGYDITDNIRLGFDVVGVRSDTGLAFRDQRAQRLLIGGQQALTPDGRIRYDSRIAGGSLRDIVAFNPGDESWLVTTALSVSGDFDNGLSGSLAYVHQDSDVFGSFADFGTTASGLYSDQYAALDPNSSVGGRIASEVEDMLKVSLQWSKKFFGDYETRFSLFGEYRDGRPINFLFSDPSATRSILFGVNRAGHLLYVPDLTAGRTSLAGADLFRNNTGGAPLAAALGNVRFGSATGALATAAQQEYIRLNGTGVIFAPTITVSPTAVTITRTAAQNLALFEQIVQRFGLPQGGIVDKGAANNPDVAQFDFQFMQELPGFRDGHRFQFTMDVQNFLNLINDEWGIIDEYTDSRTGGRVVDVLCANNAGQIQGAGVACDQYLFNNTNDGTFLRTPTRNTDESRWAILLGLRYQY